MLVNDPRELDDRRVIIIERDSGVGWMVAFIMLTLAIGFGIILFMDQQTMIEYKIEQALDRMQENQSVSPQPPVQAKLPEHLQPKIEVQFPHWEMPKLPKFTIPSPQSLASRFDEKKSDTPVIHTTQ